jgi:hypothetical protein
MLSDEEAVEVMSAVLFQYNRDRILDITPDTRFAHYTRADTAMQIIQSTPQNRSLWLRNASEMNDFSEVEYGQHCFRSALAIPALLDKFRAAVEGIHADVLRNAAQAIDAEVSRVKSNTFLLSLALHSGSELSEGILSMWRAYGGNANVCLILNTAAFTTFQTAYEVALCPVMYEGEPGFARELDRMADSLIQNRDKLMQIAPEVLEYNLKQALDFAVLSTKHPAFFEEKEWRIIHRPSHQAPRPDVPSKVVNVGGIVQTIHYLPMVNVPEHGVANADLNGLLDRIIIGPTPNPPLVRDAFVRLLADAGIANPEDRVLTSNVPLRR